MSSPGRPHGPLFITERMPSFGGGLNEVSSTAFDARPDQYVIGNNIIRYRNGGVQRRGGTQLVAATTVGGAGQPVTGLFCWKQATTHTYLVTSNGVLFTAPAYTLPFVYTNRGAIGSSTNYPSFAAFRDGSGEVCYIADGAGLRKITTALVHSAVAGSPALAQIAVYNQRLFGITGTDQTIYYSSLNNGDSCGVVSATSGSAIVRTFGSQKLTALVALRNSLAMFHVSGISRFTGLTQDDIAIGAGSEGLSVDTGTIMPRSIVAVEGVAYFLCERGAFRLTDEGIEPLEGPDQPDNLFGQLSTAAGYTANAPLITGVHDRKNTCIRWFALSGVVSYDYRHRIWVSRDYASAFNNVRAMCDGLDGNGQALVLTGDTGGNVYRTGNEDLYRDNVLADGTGGTAFEMRVQPRLFWGPEPGNQKSWATAYIYGSFDTGPAATSSTVEWETNQVAATTKTGIVDPGIAVGRAGYHQVMEVPLGTLGRWLALTFYDSTESYLRLYRIEVDAYDYGRRRA